MHAVGVEQGGGKPVGGLSFGRVKIQIYKKIHKAAKKKPKTNKMKPIDFGRKMFLKREKKGGGEGKEKANPVKMWRRRRRGIWTRTNS